MSAFRLARGAALDLEEILDFVATQSGAAQAEVVRASFGRGLRLLAELPGIGHARSDLTERDVRFLRVQRWLVVYRSDTRPVEIVRILDGARGVERLLE